MARRPQLRIAMLCLVALSAASARAQAPISQVEPVPGPEVVSSIYLCAGFTGTSLTTAQFTASSCTTGDGILIKGNLTAYSFAAGRDPGSEPLNVTAFQITRIVMDKTGVNLNKAILDGVSLGTVVIGENSTNGITEINQFTFVLKGVSVESASQSVSSSGPEESFSLAFTGLTIYDNVAGTSVTYTAPTPGVAASLKGSQSVAGRIQ
jgi:hypothetical protein